ncbi:MAG: IMP cyclohydrolase [Bacillota bacterium]
MEKLYKIADDNCEKIKNSIYPGRTIIVGISPNKKNIIQLYWTMGRSENSKNRHILKAGEDIRTEPLDKDETMLHKNLLIYNIARTVGSYHIVSNGTQTDTIYDYLKAGKKFEDAIAVMSFENDEPIFTPRISGLIRIDSGSIEYKLGIVKTIDQNPSYLLKHIYTYNDSIPGIGYCINTYDLNEECKPFLGEPYYVKLFDDIDAAADYYWNILDKQKRVGMYIKYINLESGAVEEMIVNERHR